MLEEQSAEEDLLYDSVPDSNLLLPDIVVVNGS